jgi:hypothetical protein
MDSKRPRETAAAIAQDILGYLNFSSGASDPRFLENVNKLFGLLPAGKTSREPAWRALANILRGQLQAVRGTSDAFRQVDQAEAVLRLVFDAVLPAYREFHRDLLFHQTEETLFQPLFIGRVCEAVLQQGGPWDQAERLVPAVLRQLNDYIGHRPVAVLRTAQKIQPYEHEWVRPVPLWIRGAGVADGPYRELVETALAILDATDPALMFDAMFALEQLDELAFDPRAYDFDHPVNKRPNYLFGQWDMNRLDNAGLCRRFVLQQAALDALLDRLRRRGRAPRKEILFEEAAVLAGTMLMGAGVSGNRPDAHDSTVTLAGLMEKIAVYRDAFYEQLLQNLKGRHVERLRAEAVELRQPFGGARQHFNHFLAQRRAKQLEHVHVAQLFAAMGYTAAAARQAAVVPVAAARMTCEMRCRMATAHLAAERGKLQEAAAELPPVEDLLHRAIGCGAMVDPWNILGFGGEFSLFPAIENTVHDHRVDELLDAMGDIFALYGRIHMAAAAAGDAALQHALSRDLAALARWWDKFATVEVGSVEGISGRAALESAESVAAALGAWHGGGAAAGDLAFWRRHVEHFDSPKAYAQVVNALLDHHDPVAAMALLVQWLSQAEEIPLVEENYSFHDLVLAWMEDLWEDDEEPGRTDIPVCPDLPAGATVEPSPQPAFKTPPERWSLARKFLDYLEANAEEYWEVPQFEMAADILGADGREENGSAAESEESAGDFPADEEDDLFGAAYEDVTYRDSTDDGVEGEVFEGGENPADFELVGEAERIVSRLSFLTTVAQLWKLVATASLGGDVQEKGTVPICAQHPPGRSGGHRPKVGRGLSPFPERDEVLAGWLEQATQNHEQMLGLLAAVHRHRIPPPRGTQESLVEYDQRRSVKETLLDEIIQTCVETADAARLIRASMARPPSAPNAEEWERPAGEALWAVLRGDAAAVRGVFPALLRALAGQPLLYVALGQGGSPGRIVASRHLQYVIRRLLSYLPRLGLLSETCRLLETAQRMESEHPVRPGAVGITEFDGILEITCKALSRCLVVSSAQWAGKKGAVPLCAQHPSGRSGGHRPEVGRGLSPFSRESDDDLVDCLEQTVDVLLHTWLNHGRSRRLSVLETVDDPRRWKRLKQFIESYGGDLFTQQFMYAENLRGILHQGVREYLKMLQDEPDPDEPFRLVADLDGVIPLREAAYWLGITIEAVVENYGEYIDYNSVTTQSDRGEMLYTLLDFLRLRASYDRVAWHFRPMMFVHQVLVRSGRDGAAEIWRAAIAEWTAPLAAEHLTRFDRLCKKYAMRLPSIAERLAQRFVRPLEVDRLCAWIRPAIEEIRDARPPAALERLEEQIAELMKEPSGAGFELPGWLDALDQELEQSQWSAAEEEEETFDPHVRLPQILLSRAEVERQIHEMLGDQ